MARDRRRLFSLSSVFIGSLSRASSAYLAVLSLRGAFQNENDDYFGDIEMGRDDDGCLTLAVLGNAAYPTHILLP